MAESKNIAVPEVAKEEEAPAAKTPAEVKEEDPEEIVFELDPGMFCSFA